MQRRKFVQGALAGSALVSAASLLPQSVLAEWPKADLRRTSVS